VPFEGEKEKKESIERSPINFDEFEMVPPEDVDGGSSVS